MDKVSIIIPIYNTSKYLKQCLDTVSQQTYQNIEVLLVDDGSTDNSLQICQKYAQQDPRFRVIYEQNGGLSAARNKGVSLATGDLLAFIDGDDYVDVHYIEYLLNSLHKFNTDIAVSSYYQIDDHYTFFFPMSPAGDIQRFDGKYSNQKWAETSFKLNGIICNAAWGKLYKKEVFNNVSYPTNDKVGEDQFTTWKTYLNADCISFTNKQTYIYRINPSSLRHTHSNANGLGVQALEEKIAFLNLVGWQTDYMHDLYRQRLQNAYDEALGNGEFEKATAFQFKLTHLHR